MSIFALSALAAGIAVGCAPYRDNDARPGDLGDDCRDDSACRGGLACSGAGACELVGEPGTVAADGVCSTDLDCRFGLVCNGTGRCARERKARAGGRCFADTDCSDALACGSDGTCKNPGEPGTAAAGAECADDTTCRYGLICGEAFQCAALPLWGGVECGATTEPGPPRVLFEVPRGVVNDDFFRLPYPNDVRRIGNVIDLAQFPGLNGPPAPGAFVSDFVAAVAQSAERFGLSPAVFFRFSAPVNYESLTFTGDDATFVFVDITPDNLSRSRRPRARFFATTERARFICHHWLGIRPSEGSPLEEGHTYAVYFRRGLTAATGAPLEPDSDFAAMLAPTPPRHPALAAAWTRYGVFRDWLSAEGIPFDEIIGGTVFTTGQPTQLGDRLRAAADSGPAPSFRDLVECDGSTPSPCTGPGQRTCGTPQPGFREYHARVELPSYLQGQPPFAEWGGTIRFEDGRPRPQRSESACVAITVPRVERHPASGWPLILYAHDAGDHYRSFITRGVAERLTAEGWAVASFDAVAQGGRSGLATPPEAVDLVALLEPLNDPVRLRDLVSQEVLDLFAFARGMATLQIPDSGGRPATFNADRMSLFAHGRGARAGVIFVAIHPTLQSVVLASAGGGAADLMRLPRAPVNRAARLAEALADSELNGMHPALHLIQQHLDPVDPANYARLLRFPAEGGTAKNVLQIYSVDDRATPGPTQSQIAISARLDRLGEELERLEAVPGIEGSSARGNAQTSSGPRTQVLRMYAPDGSYDGSEVAFRHPEAVADIGWFFHSLIRDRDELPTVGR